MGYWEALDRLVAEGKIIIDRPKGSAHPRYPKLIYPLDYGYLEGTTSGDGDGIDVWIGSRQERSLTAIECTYDHNKLDMEVKLLIGCSAEDIEQILATHNCAGMHGILVNRPQ
ncbi:inorganic pyrophosphatase [bacterium]|nr:inorganic pyrophosphatase [bacterium]